MAVSKKGAGMETGRLEAFSDGVMAVAITLLVLNLAVSGPGHGTLTHQLYEKRWAFAAFGVSFFTIGIIWVNHHNLFKSITQVDRPMLFINLVLLVFVVLIPFVTATLAQYLPAVDAGRSDNLAAVLYCAVMEGMAVSFSLIYFRGRPAPAVHRSDRALRRALGHAAVQRRVGRLPCGDRGGRLQRSPRPPGEPAGRRLLRVRADGADGAHGGRGGRWAHPAASRTGADRPRRGADDLVDQAVGHRLAAVMK